MKEYVPNWILLAAIWILLLTIDGHLETIIELLEKLP